MQIKIIFNKKAIKEFMEENKLILPQLLYLWGLRYQKTKQMLEDALYIDSKFVSKIVATSLDIDIYNSENIDPKL